MSNFYTYPNILRKCQTVPYPIVGATREQLVSEVNCERTVNFYQIDDDEAKQPIALQAMPGIKTVCTLGSDILAGGRGSLDLGDFSYVVYGNKFYRLDSNLNPTVLGNNLSTDSGPVRFSNNQNQIMFVDGVDGYLWNFTTQTGLFPVPRIDTSKYFPEQPIDITNYNGYFSVTQGESNSISYSALNDGTVWEDTTHVAQTFEITFKPDQCMAIKVVNGRMFIFGGIICEQWIDDPVGLQVFSRVNNMCFEYGTPATASVTEDFGRLCFISSNKNGYEGVRMSDGGEPILISDPPLDRILKEYEQQFGIDDAVGEIYKESGHLFYEISFTKANHTWVGDLTYFPQKPVRWVEREMQDESRFVGQNYFNFNGKNYVLDYKTNKLYEMSSNFYDYDGAVFRRMRVGRPFTRENQKLFRVSRFRIDMVTGVGTQNGEDQDPQVFLSISRDGGVTYGNTLKASSGKVGNRTAQVKFFKLGSQQEWVPRLEFYASIPTTVIGAFITYDELER